MRMAVRTTPIPVGLGLAKDNKGNMYKVHF
jgi:hypothetical protein